MQLYKVGGAVRDEILGVRPRDTDYVVVGSTPAEMQELGFKPVGGSFPVFLHPETKSEYALARTERKTGKGHGDFVFHASPEVTLEEDLSRRDFTINAIAEHEDGRIIDPYDGRHDISKRILRHVSPAFREDPLRVLRAVRYASGLGFIMAPATMELVRKIVAAGELAHLSAERIWQELSRGLISEQAVAYVNTLRKTGVLAAILPEVEALFGVKQNPRSHPEGCAGTHALLVLNVAALNWWPLAVRCAALLHDVGKATTPPEDLPSHPGHEKRGAVTVQSICARLRVPAKVAKAVVAATREHGLVHGFAQLTASEKVMLFGRLSAWRNRADLDCLLAVASCDHAAQPDVDNYSLHPQRNEVLATYAATMQADVAAAAKSTSSDKAAAVFAARVALVEDHIRDTALAN